MAKQISSGQKKTIVIVLGVVIALLVGVLTTSTVVVLQASSGKALPEYNKKDSSQALGSASNPFTILEIVPDVESAMVGYLIKGSEPGESNRLLRIGTTDKNVDGTPAQIYNDAFGTGENRVSEVGDFAESHIFVADAPDVETEFVPKYDVYETEGSTGTGKGFSEFGYFTLTDSESGNYVYDTDNKCFTPISFENMDKYNHYTWTSLGEFKHVGAGNIEPGKVACTREMYTGEVGADGELVKRGFSYNLLGDNAGKGAVGTSAYNYYFNQFGDFEWVPNNNYNNENVFVENATDEKIRNATSSDKLYMTRTEDVYYEYEASSIVCYDRLVQGLLGNGRASALDYKMNVVTVTPSQLDVSDSDASEAQKAKDIIDDADMIIIHDSATGYKIEYALQGVSLTDEKVPKFINNNNYSGDFSAATANYIIERGAGYDAAKGRYPAAIVIDDDAINTANSYSDSKSNCTNLKLVCDVYNNLGAKMAYNLSGTNYSVKLNSMKNDNEYKNFYRNYDYANRGENKDALGKSNFVYNFEGKDDSWLTTDFANNNKIVNNNETSPAFENINGGQTMSVANMLSAIYKESLGYNQPDKIRILELQPNEKFYYNSADKNSWVKRYVSLFPWFIGTSKDLGDGNPEGDGDVGITTMPTYEFIGRNEDPNENYDMVIIGNKEQDATNGGLNGGKAGYNDALPNQMAYTSVGDLITTFGGDEIADQAIENNESYKWHYGVFRDNKWSWTKHAYIQADRGWYVYSDTYANFKKRFVYQYYDYKDGSNITAGLFGPWWYEYSPGGLFANGFDVFATKHGSDANMIGLRYSGNDLTKKKYNQLLDFANQGPVIVSDDLYSTAMGDSDNPNPYTLDKSSFIFQLAKKNLDESAVNKYVHGVTDRINTVKKNMEEYTCYATFTDTTDSTPKEYNENDDPNYNEQKDADGNNALKYHFVLNGNEDSTYGVNVYTDSNGNGIFEGCINYKKERAANDKDPNKGYDTEMSASLTIYDESENKYVLDGNLKSGNTYLVTRTLPPSVVGMTPWKLEIYDRGNDAVRFSKTGYTRILSNGKKTTIKVLQMNLMPSMQDNAPDTTVNFADNSAVGRKFKNYVSGMDDFNIELTFMDNQTWWRKYGGNRTKWTEDLMEYDMLVIGFKDVANFTNDEDYIYGFTKFLEAGKSVILSHDLVQDVTIKMTQNIPNSDTTGMIQSDVRYYLRDISGQIRKYYDAESGSNDYSYMDYKSNGRELTFEPSDNFNIFTSIKQSWTSLNIDTHEMSLEVRENYNINPVFDKYTYTYGDFDNPALTETFGTIRHPDHREMAITTPSRVIRDYYATHEHKPANLIMDNSIRAMLFYNYIYYVENTKYGPTKGFVDRIDRLVRNIDLSNQAQRRKLVWGEDAFLTNKVVKANDGQITKYPFAIPDEIFVADTHAQNYQLDLEYDNDGDVLVWYNLGGTGNRNDGGRSQVNSNSISVYDGKNQDSRNNYYIYTKGNVTYTGLGHSTNSNSPMSDYEIKLFINTMVAAYRSSAASPYIGVLNHDAVNNGKTTTLYADEASTEIRLGVFDDTTNAKILSSREYTITVKKDGVVVPGFEAITRNSSNRDEPIVVPVSYSDIVASDSVEYTIELDSSYKDDLGNTVNTEGLDDTRTVNVTLMPMFNLR